MNYETNARLYVTNVETKVTFKDWYGLSPYQFDATFDFSKIPKELHSALFNRLCNDYNGNRKGIFYKEKKSETKGWLEKILNYKIF